MERLEVTRSDPGGLRFRVRVEPDGGPATEHDVTVTDATLSSLGAGYDGPEAFVEASFRFLLAREPNTSILRSFDVDEIERYFPGFREAIRRT